MKTMDLNKNIYELTVEYPELIDILSELGFAQIKNPVLRKTVGKTVTLTAACGQLNLDFDSLKKMLKEKDFVIKE